MATSFASPTTTTIKQTKALQLPISRAITTPSLTSFPVSTYDISQAKSTPVRLPGIKIPIQSKEVSSLTNRNVISSIKIGISDKIAYPTRKSVIPGISFPKSKTVSPVKPRVRMAPPRRTETSEVIGSDPLKQLVTNAERQIKELEDKHSVAVSEDEKRIYAWKIREIQAARDAAIKVSEDGRVELENEYKKFESERKEITKYNEETTELTGLIRELVNTKPDTEEDRQSVNNQILELSERLEEVRKQTQTKNDAVLDQFMDLVSLKNQISEKAADAYVRESARQYQETKDQVENLVSEYENAVKTNPEDIDAQLALERWSRFRNYLNSTDATVTVAEMERARVLIQDMSAESEILKVRNANLLKELEESKKNQTEQVQSLKAENEELKKQVSDLNKRVEEQVNQSEVTKKLQSQLNEQKSLIDGYVKQLSENKALIDNLKSRLDEEMKKNVKSDETIKQLNAELKAAQDKANVTENRLSEALNVNSLTKKQRDDLLRQLDPNYDPAKIQQLQNQLANSNGRIKELEDNLRNKDNIIDGLRRDNENLKNTTGDNKRFLDRISELENQVKNLTDENAKLRGSIAEKDKKISELTAKVNQLQDEVNKLKEVNRNLLEKITTLQNENNVLKRQLDEEKSKVNALNQKVRELEQKVKAKDTEIIRLQEEKKALGDARAERDRLKGDLAKARGDLNIANANIKKKDDEIKNKDIQIGGLRKELDESKKREEEANKDPPGKKKDDLDREKKAKEEDQKKIKALTAQLQEREKETTRLKSELDDKKEELEKAKKSNNRGKQTVKNDEIDKLRNENKNLKNKLSISKRLYAELAGIVNTQTRELELLQKPTVTNVRQVINDMRIRAEEVRKKWKAEANEKSPSMTGGYI